MTNSAKKKIATNLPRHKKAKKVVYVQRDIMARSREHCYRGEAMIVT